MAQLTKLENLKLRAIGNYNGKFNNYTHVEDIDKLIELLYEDLVEINIEVNELQEREIQFQYYEVVSGTSSGNQINVPADARILLDKFGDSGDAILSRVNGNGNPTFESPRDSSGNITTTGLDVQGNYTFSSIPQDPQVAIIYTFKIQQQFTENLDENFILTETELKEPTIYTANGIVSEDRSIEFLNNNLVFNNLGTLQTNAENLNWIASSQVSLLNTGTGNIVLNAGGTGNLFMNATGTGDVCLNGFIYPKLGSSTGSVLTLLGTNNIQFQNVNSLLDATTVKTVYESNADTNEFTDAEKTKLAGIEDSLFLGQFASLMALTTAHPTALIGSYAYVDAGIGQNVEQYIWDDTDNVWLIQSGTPTSETPASIKTKYESNPDTNVFTNANLVKLANIEDSADVTDTANVDAAGATMNSDTTMSGNGYFLDEDDLASDDATKVASQQSIKKYIDDSIYTASIQSNLGLINQTVAFEPFFIRETLPNVDATGTWTVTPPVDGDYELYVSFRHSLNVTTVNFLAHILRNGSTFDIPLHVESKDAGGVGTTFPSVSNNTLGGNVNSGTDQFLQAAGSQILKGLTAGVAQTFRLEFAGQTANQEACIYDARLIFRRIKERNI